MQTVTYTQEQAKGFFDANTKFVVIEYILPDLNEPLEISGSRGRPISNGAALRRLDQLANPQKYLFDNHDSRKKEKRCGFTRWIPEGREADVLFRVTLCDNKTEAKIVSKLWCQNKLSKNRKMRRDIPVVNSSHVRLLKNDDLVVEAGTSTNVAVKVS